MKHIRRNERGQLTISDHIAADLAERFGTPLYVYSGVGSLLIMPFSSAVSELDCVLHYAVKANSSPVFSACWHSKGLVPILFQVVK